MHCAYGFYEFFALHKSIESTYIQNIGTQQGVSENSRTKDDRIHEVDPILRQLAEVPRNLRRAEQAFGTRVERHRHDAQRYTIRCTASDVTDSRIRSGILLLPIAASM
jgi:hypothetical protein